MNPANFNYELKHSRQQFYCIVWLMFFGSTAWAIEEPEYTVLKTDKSFELRAYQPMIIAEVKVSGDMKQASSRGFKLIADFIFGNNTSTNGESSKISMTKPVTMEPQNIDQQSEKISMTVPVTMEQSTREDKDSWSVHFVMPSEYTLETLPKPNDERVKIRQIQETNYAVIKFSGFTGDEKVKRKTSELLEWMESESILPVGVPELARYNPPITPPFLRRNEVKIKY